MYCTRLEQEKEKASLRRKSFLKRHCSHGNSLTTNSLTNNPHARMSSKFFYGCTSQTHLMNYIHNFDYEFHFKYDKSLNLFNVSEIIENAVETLQICIDICISFSKMAAYNQAEKRCICVVAMYDDMISQLKTRDACLAWYKSNENDASLYEIHHTGFLGKFRIILWLVFDWWRMVPE